MEITLKNLYDKVGSPFVLDPSMTYPEIPEDLSNFLTEYTTNKADYDRYFLKEFGKMVVEVDAETDADIITYWKDEITAIQRVYIEAWAHIFYTLNIAYNPVYNVTEDIETEYGQHVTTDAKAAQHNTTQYGATQDTFGAHIDNSTQYGVATDSQTEKEIGKNVSDIAEQVNSSLSHTDTTDLGSHTDTNTSQTHTDKVHREGNIGIKSASALSEEEIFLREKRIFFKMIFKTICREVGAYYDFTLI